KADDDDVTRRRKYPGNDGNLAARSELANRYADTDGPYQAAQRRIERMQNGVTPDMGVSVFRAQLAQQVTRHQRDRQCNYQYQHDIGYILPMLVKIAEIPQHSLPVPNIHPAAAPAAAIKQHEFPADSTRYGASYKHRRTGAGSAVVAEMHGARAFFLLAHLALVHFQNITGGQHTGQVLLFIDNQQPVSVVAHHQDDGRTQTVAFLDRHRWSLDQRGNAVVAIVLQRQQCAPGYQAAQAAVRAQHGKALELGIGNAGQQPVAHIGQLLRALQRQQIAAAHHAGV